MFLSIVLWALGALLLFWFFAMLMALPRAAGSLIDRKPRESPLKKFVDEYERNRISAAPPGRK